MEQTIEPIWMTARLTGELQSGSDSCHALRSSGCAIDLLEEEVLARAKFRADHGGKKLDLVVRSGRELGLEYGGSRRQIYGNAAERGLRQCPHELGPYLRLQYRNQPSGEGLMIAMEPIPDRLGTEHIFYIGCDAQGIWFDAYSCEVDFWYGHEKWIFVREEG